MSALAEKVAREHQRVFNAKVGFGPHCTCGWVHPRYDGPQRHVRHIAEVTEAAVRAQVAADVRATHQAVRDHIAWYEEGDARVWAQNPDEAAADILDRLARIAEGGP